MSAATEIVIGLRWETIVTLIVLAVIFAFAMSSENRNP